MPTAVGKIIPHRPSSCQEKNAKKLYKNAAPKKLFFVHFDEEKNVDILTRVCYYNYRKRKKGDKKMRYYEVCAYKTAERFNNKTEALAFFEDIKNCFTYCEVKEVTEDANGYYAKSLKIKW